MLSNSHNYDCRQRIHRYQNSHSFQNFCFLQWKKNNKRVTTVNEKIQVHGGLGPNQLILIRENLIHVGESFYFWFGFILIHNSFWYAIQIDFILILIRREARFTYLWFLIRFDFDPQVNHDSRVRRDLRRIKIKPNQNEYNQFESRIKINQKQK